MCSVAFGGRTVRTVTPVLTHAELDTMPDMTGIYSTNFVFENDVAVLIWQPTRRSHPTTNKPLSGYRVFGGTDTGHLEYLSTVRRARYFDSEHSLEQNYLYRVFAYYGGQFDLKKLPSRVRRDDLVLYDFEDEDIELLSFSDEEDIDPDDWEITDEESLPESAHSLVLRGNTWKRMIFERTDLTDSTVWSLGILSVDGDTMARQQTFGLGDGVNTLFYTYHGIQTIWDHAWNVSSQDINRRGRWEVHRMAVGYDFKIRFGYLPSIDELFFINDNDNNQDQSAVIYFDELTDITESLASEPILKIRAFRRNHLDADGEAFHFTADVDNRDLEDISFYWEFGDGSTSTMQNPTHIFRRDGRYTVAVTARDQSGNTDGEIVRIEVGRSRTINRLTASFTGDVMLARRYESNGGIIRQFGPETVFSRIADRLNQSDLVVINLESVLTDEGTRHPMKQYVFRGNPANVAGLTYAGVNIATLANNHMSDYGRRGLEETIEVLDAAGIVHTGAGMNEYDALQPVFKTFNGIRVGVLAYCNRTGRDYNNRPFLDASFDSYGYAYFSLDNIQRSVAEAADLCDFLVVTIHGGEEYGARPANLDPDEVIPDEHDHIFDHYHTERDSATREFEHLCINLGADLIVSHHPHVIQGFEVYEGAVIAHSLGNFAFDQNLWETWVSALMNAEIDENGLRSVTVDPIFVNNYRPTPTIGALGKKILDRLAAYSYELNAIVIPEYNQMKARLVMGNDRVVRRVSEHEIMGEMRYYDEENVYRSEPLRLIAGGFPSEIVAIDPSGHDVEWELSLGREIMLVGNMEAEGADIWNYNSNNEGREEEIVHGGRYASWLFRRAGWQDGITDLKQRIPVNQETERLTLCGYLRTTNCRDAGLLARYYNSRYGNNNNNILGDQPVEQRFQGDHDWMYLWDQLVIPEGTTFVNVRWQNYGPEEGESYIWADDVELMRWEDFQPFNGTLNIDVPNDTYYLQVQTRRPVETISVTYRTTTLDIE